METVARAAVGRGRGCYMRPGAREDYDGAGRGWSRGGLGWVPYRGARVVCLSSWFRRLEYLVDLLRKTQYRELSEVDLRENWDGGAVGDGEMVLAKKSKGEFTGVVPGRTKKWKEFQGLAFD